MKKILAFTMVFCLLAQSAFAFSVSYQQKISLKGSSMGLFNVKMKDGKMRAEAKMGNMTSIMIRNDKAAYNYFPEQNMAVSVPQELGRPNLAKDLEGYKQFLTDNKAELIGNETIDGKECEIYQFTDPTSNTLTKAWLWKEKQFPVKFEVQTPDGLMAIELVEINFEPGLSDADFELPEGVKVMGADQMAAAAQALQQAAHQ